MASLTGQFRTCPDPGHLCLFISRKHSQLSRLYRCGPGQTIELGQFKLANDLRQFVTPGGDICAIRASTRSWWHVRRDDPTNTRAGEPGCRPADFTTEGGTRISFGGRRHRSATRRLGRDV